MQYKFNLSEYLVIIINDITLLQTGLAIQAVKALNSANSLPLSFRTNLKTTFQNNQKLSNDNFNTLENLLTNPDNKLCESIFKDITNNLWESNYFQDVLSFDEQDTLEFIKTNLWSQLANLRTGKQVNELMENETSYGKFFQAFYSNARFMRQFEEMMTNILSVLPENDPSSETEFIELIQQVAHTPGAGFEILIELYPQLAGMRMSRNYNEILTATEIYNMLPIAHILLNNEIKILENGATTNNLYLKRALDAQLPIANELLNVPMPASEFSVALSKVQSFFYENNSCQYITRSFSIFKDSVSKGLAGLRLGNQEASNRLHIE